MQPDQGIGTGSVVRWLTAQEKNHSPHIASLDAILVQYGVG